MIVADEPATEDVSVNGIDDRLTLELALATDDVGSDAFDKEKLRLKDEEGEKDADDAAELLAFALCVLDGSDDWARAHER